MLFVSCVWVLWVVSWCLCGWWLCRWCVDGGWLLKLWLGLACCMSHPFARQWPCDCLIITTIAQPLLNRPPPISSFYLPHHHLHNLPTTSANGSTTQEHHPSHQASHHQPDICLFDPPSHHRLPSLPGTVFVPIVYVWCLNHPFVFGLHYLSVF